MNPTTSVFGAPPIRKIHGRGYTAHIDPKLDEHWPEASRAVSEVFPPFAPAFGDIDGYSLHEEEVGVLRLQTRGRSMEDWICPVYVHLQRYQTVHVALYSNNDLAWSQALKYVPGARFDPVEVGHFYDRLDELYMAWDIELAIRDGKM